MDRRLIRSALAGIAIFSFGCDPNPDGPSAPSAPPPGTFQTQPDPDPETKGKGKDRGVPLRKVGQPISQ